MSRLRARRVAPAVAVAVTAAACGGGSSGGSDAFGLPLDRPVTMAELRAHPQSALTFPRSHLLRRVGADEQKRPGADEPDPAYAGVVATAPVGAARLFAWYDARLSSQGYQRAAYYRTSEQVAGRAWTAQRGREQVQVAVYDRAWAASHHVAVPAGGVAYEELLVDYRVTGPPPSP